MQVKGFAVWEHSKRFKWYISKVFTYGRYGGWEMKSSARSAAMDYIVATEKNATIFKHVIESCVVLSTRK